MLHYLRQFISIFKLLCQGFPECKFFHADQLYCTLFSEKVMDQKCNGVAGPPEPSQLSCQATTTTLGE